jgi:hypothetical protein
MSKVAQTDTDAKLAAIEVARKRWSSRLKRAVTMLEKLERKRQRLLRPAKQAQVKALPPEKPKPLYETLPKEELAAARAADALDIPGFLRRGQRKSQPTPEAVQIAAEAEDRKRRKALGRIAKMKAEKSGATRAMPLTGKAALEAIRNAK